MKQQQPLFPKKADKTATFELAPEVGTLDNLQTLIEENYSAEDVPVLFDRVRIPPGGVTQFQVPGDDPDDPEMVPEIVGVIVDHYRVNAYWPGGFTGEGTPPQCYSHDGVTGIGDPGGPCDRCPNYAWGSGKEGRGRACKNMRRLYILRPNDVLPVVLTLPPTSLGTFRDFLKNLTFRHRMKLTEAVVRIGLKKAKNPDGIVYSEVTLMPVGKLSKEQAQVVKQYAEAMKPFMRRPPHTAVEMTLDYAPGDARTDPAEFGKLSENPDF